MNSGLFPQAPAVLTIALGIAGGLFWTRRTGWNCGGIITPGLMALYAGEPLRALAVLAIGAALTPALSLAARSLGLYGRERTGAAMLLSLAAAALLSLAAPPSAFWIGWVIPGLIAADAERQGLIPTLCGAVSSALAASFVMRLLGAAFGG